MMKLANADKRVFQRGVSMAASTLPGAGCLSLRSAAGEHRISLPGERPLQRDKCCTAAEFGWYRGFLSVPTFWLGRIFYLRNSNCKKVAVESVKG